MVEIALDGNWVVLRLAGDIDMASATAIGECLKDLQDAGYHSMRVDLARVAFMDSQGVNMLVAASKRADRAGGTIVAVNPNRQVRKLIGMTGLDRLLRVGGGAKNDNPAA